MSLPSSSSSFFVLPLGVLYLGVVDGSGLALDDLWLN